MEVYSPEVMLIEFYLIGEIALGLHTSTEWRTFQYLSKYLGFTQCARALAQESFLTSLFKTYILKKDV